MGVHDLGGPLQVAGYRVGLLAGQLLRSLRKRVNHRAERHARLCSGVLGDDERLAPAVGGVGGADDMARVLEAVDERRRRRAADPESVSELDRAERQRALQQMIEGGEVGDTEPESICHRSAGILTGALDVAQSAGDASSTFGCRRVPRRSGCCR
jgi:hypothetical protein